MPDIRSFFGGSSQPSQDKSAPSTKKAPAKAKPEAKGRGKRKVVSDDEEDDEPPAKKATPKRALPKRAAKAESPVGEETNTSDYFGSKKKKTAAAPAVKKEASPAPQTPQKATPKKAQPAAGSAKSTRTSARRGASKKSYAEAGDDKDDEEDDDGDFKMLKDDEDSGDDVFEAEYKGRGRKQADDYEESDDDMEIIEPSRGSKTNGAKAGPGRKRKSSEVEEEKTQDSKRAKSTPKKATPKKAAPSQAKSKAPKTANKDQDENPEIEKIFSEIPTVRPPTPPAGTSPKKFDFKASAARQQAQDSTTGLAEIPEGAEDCLAGLTFVFTGQLKTLGREEGQSLVKRYGGKVTTTPSKNTSFVILGEDAGPKKLEKIHSLGIRTIDENGLFALISRLPAHGGGGKAAEKAAEKKAKDEQKAKEAAEEEARIQAKQAADRKKAAAASASAGRPAERKRDPNDELWTVKYAPSSLNQICGNKSSVEKLQGWLRNWQRNAKRKFKVGGPDGSGIYRTVIISGKPGIGKTTSAHLVAKLEGYDVVETNASDTRSKKLVEQGLRGVLDTTSLMGYFAGDGKSVATDKKKLVLIMDEVDGMSAGDRGGVGALASVCRKTNIPMILICNERKLPKMKPFDGCTYGLSFNKPTVDQVRGRIMTILFREGMKDLVPVSTVNALIEGTGADIRQIINMLSTAKLDQERMGFDEGKSMAKSWEKNVILKPWDITHKILGSGMFAPSSRSTLNDKIELYFNDHEFSSLMLQENYLKTTPSESKGYNGKEQKLKVLEMVDRAAESISDGDLVDRMIHGNQQQWSLMPTHAVFSFVRPASFVNGPFKGQVSFTSYLGNLSKTGKLTRFVKEIQSHMRLRASADRHDIRQQYLPLLWQRIIKRLEASGSDPTVVEDIIELMDSYFLTKDDWDAILELGVGGSRMEDVDIPSAVKSNFTRKYNAQSHPLPFMKANANGPPPKGFKEKPDLEEALEESDDDLAPVDSTNDPGSDEEELDLKKDKYVQAPKKKKKAAAAPKKSGAKGKGKGKAAKKGNDEDDDDEMDEDEEEDVKPKPKGKGRGRPKK